MTTLYILIGFVIGTAFGFILHLILTNYPEIGILHVDLTDIRKDILKFELTKDLDEFVGNDYVYLKIDSKYEDDFKPVRSNTNKFAFGAALGIVIVLIIGLIFGVRAVNKQEETYYKKTTFVYEAPPIPMPELSIEDPVYSEDDPIYDIEATYPSFDSNSLDWDWDYVVRVVAQEAGLTAEWLSPEENDIRVRAQMAVAQCIKNTAEATGQTPEQVVKVPGQYAKPYQGNEDEMEMVNESCLRVFVCGETVTDEPIRYFYSTAGGFYSKWHENCLTFVEKIGPTKFFVA